ncbi:MULTISPECIES: sugar phosphate isomerase/epimerase family protein [Agrobacterium]|uniref:Hydroxypyruvate isomerase n=1 Tax=Agrobacterium rosae TaxID=1972867 RepID=A0A1R3TNS5_9HYPH|nr:MULTISPECIES: sugar phosphate isomerase/epimerase family protein [Agrobacterium]KAA3511672.1 sugar phosphate isomerase/epimerase [Agrobacterium rosae]KAA3518906.1 sugar phosphate isomerase/epimerase [Agrobacterium rosae]MCM2435146.1 sugar phosphate isomerase/epimerase [Agrobacterium rosae]MDX8314216.1 sugar phosphate isomerase/epimerase family protein [Agrobacterium rosae]MDX8331119.1 sugar phosphate isomerase/epimerase family protein [Agrobacterium rosae]
MSLEGLSINFATIKQGGSFGTLVDACLAQGITTISPWRDQVHGVGLEEAARIVAQNGIRLSGHCRGGFFPAPDAEGRRNAIEDNKRAVDEAQALNADCLVLVVGGLPAGSKDIKGARQMVEDGMAELLPYARQAGIPLAIEPLHPFYAADRACFNTLKQSLDLCDKLGEGTGVAIDVYHVWWDPELEEQVARAGRNGQIFAHHICDWLVPTTDPLNDRGMMGDGVIDLRGFRRMIEQAGFFGPQEVEIFSYNWNARPIDEVLSTVVERFQTVCQP